jgi:hypothetical protein
MACYLLAIRPERDKVSRCAPVFRKHRAVLEAVSREHIAAIVSRNRLLNRQHLPIGEDLESQWHRRVVPNARSGSGRVVYWKFAAKNEPSNDRHRYQLRACTPTVDKAPREFTPSSTVAHWATYVASQRKAMKGSEFVTFVDVTTSTA